MRNYLAIVFGVMLLSGCATGRRAVPPETTAVDEPPLNKDREVELGDTLVKKGKLSRYRSITLQNKISAGDGIITKKWHIEPGVLVQSAVNDRWDFYRSDRFTSHDLMLGTMRVEGGLMIANAGTNQTVKLWSGNVSMGPNEKPIFEKGYANATEATSFQQELIYNGRVGSQVKFLYREFTNDRIRGPFSQEVQYDLGEGKEIGFKGVRIEIIEATNTRLKYRVLKSFPD